MKIRVIDFETEGTDKDRLAGRPTGIVEVGWTDVFYHPAGSVVGMPGSAVINCELPISPECRAVHHITDEEIATGISEQAGLAALMESMAPGDMFAAHAAQFERAFFPIRGHDWICTYVSARHVLEDAPGYSNQILRYWLGTDRDMQDRAISMPPHRAGPDSYVTAHTLRRLLLVRSPDELVTLSKTPFLLKTVSFGKNEGRPWSEMDPGFLEWILGKDFNEETKYTARHWLQIHRTSQPAPIYPF